MIHATHRDHCFLLAAGPGVFSGIFRLFFFVFHTTNSFEFDFWTFHLFVIIPVHIYLYPGATRQQQRYSSCTTYLVCTAVTSVSSDIYVFSISVSYLV